MCKSLDCMESHAGRIVVSCNAIFAEHFNAGIRSAALPDISSAYPAMRPLSAWTGKAQSEIYDCVIDFGGRSFLHTTRNEWYDRNMKNDKPRSSWRCVNAIFDPSVSDGMTEKMQSDKTQFSNGLQGGKFDTHGCSISPRAIFSGIWEI